MKNKILNNLSFIVIVITLVVICIFKDSGRIMLYTAGVGITVYGLLISLLRNRYGSVSLGVGFSLLISMLIYDNKILDKVDSITFFICLTLSIVIVIAYIFMFFEEKNIKKKYDLEIEAEVVDLEKNLNTKKEYYRPVYMYCIDEVEYRVMLPYYLDKKFPKIGDKIKLHIDSKDYADVYFKRNLINEIRYWGSGLILLLISIVIIISLF